MKTSSVKAASSATAVVSRIQFTEKPISSALYGDSFDKIVLTKSLWASYIDYLIREGFDRLPMYNIKEFMVPANFKLISEFILYARGRGIFSIEAVWGSLNRFQNYILPYQNWCTMRAQAIDRVNLENEPYRFGAEGSESVDWATEDSWRKTVYAICRSWDTKVIRWRLECTKYHGWNKPSSYGGPQWTAAQIADSLVTTTDDLLLHCYCPNPEFERVEGRLREIDTAATKAGKKDYQIYVLLSSESKLFKEKDGSFCKNEFSGKYLKTKTTIDWYTEFVGQMRAYLTTKPAFTNIIVVGVYDFDKWYHVQARP